MSRARLCRQFPVYVFIEIGGNVDIWTSAVQTDCPYKFKWCGTGGTLQRNDSRWQSTRYILKRPMFTFFSILGAPLVRTCTQRINFVCTHLLIFLILARNQLSWMTLVHPQNVLCVQYVYEITLVTS